MFAITSALLQGFTIPGSTVSLEQETNTKGSFNYTDNTGAEQVAGLNTYLITPRLVADITVAASDSTLNPALNTAIQSYSHKVGVGDVLNVTVWNHPELTIPAGSYRSSTEAGTWVHADGTIFYPYVGNVKVEGKNVVEIRALLTKKQTKYIESPQVDVNISAFRSQRAYLTGEVSQPGPVEINNVPLTLIEAVNSATGLTEAADRQNVKLTRA